MHWFLSTIISWSVAPYFPRQKISYAAEDGKKYSFETCVWFHLLPTTISSLILSDHNSKCKSKNHITASPVYQVQVCIMIQVGVSLITFTNCITSDDSMCKPRLARIIERQWEPKTKNNSNGSQCTLLFPSDMRLVRCTMRDRVAGSLLPIDKLLVSWSVS